MAIFNTDSTKVLMPRNIAAGMITETRTLSTVAALSAREPQRFGEVDYIVFNDFPKAEFVEEGAQKGGTNAAFSSVTAKPHKAQVTLRFSEEVQWQDEDYQLGVLTEIANAGQIALARALDLGLYHRINPLTGAEITGWDNYLLATTNVVTQNTADADADFRTAIGLLVNASPSWGVNGSAWDPKFSWQMANLMEVTAAGGISTGRQRYPDLGFGTNVTGFLGIPVSQGDTVSGTPEAADTLTRAIVGDYRNGIRWGVQRDFPVELIRFGDPDGQGDLKRQNQIAMRLEIVYGWYVFPERFAVIKAKSTP